MLRAFLFALSIGLFAVPAESETCRFHAKKVAAVEQGLGIELLEKVLRGRVGRATVDPRTQQKNFKIVGGHGSEILTDPSYRVLEKSKNPDGTWFVKFQVMVDAGDGTRVPSNIKSSTVVPVDWTNEDVLDAVLAVKRTPLAYQSAKTRDIYHEASHRGVAWEVVTDAEGTVKAAYPLGGRPPSWRAMRAHEQGTAVTPPTPGL